MSDILKHIRYPASSRNDPEGNLFSVAPWSEREAEARARDMGIEMTEDHWDVVLFVRDHYRGRGDNAAARELLDALEEEYAEDGGARWLFLLFPKGPIAQACQIAGIPEPRNTRNPSFGTTH